MTSRENSKPERLKKGSVPPFLPLLEAFELARRVYEQGGGQASPDLMSRLTGNSSSSSTFLKKISSLKLYGIVTEENGPIELTEQGRALAAPLSHDLDWQARKASFLSVPTYSKLYERHKGKLLPADEFLKNILGQDIGVPKELSSDWVKSFKDAAKAAGLLLTRPDGKIQVLESPGSPPDDLPLRQEPSEFRTSANRPAFVDNSGKPLVPAGSQSVPIAASGHNTRLELSGGRVAEFNIPFGITPQDARRLKGILKGLDLIIDSAVIGEEEPET